MADEFDPDAFLKKQGEQPFNPDTFLAQPAKRTNTTIMDYPEIYGEMNRESREQMARGVQQLGTPTGGDLPSSVWETVKGVGNIGLGALGYVGSPIAAGIRAVVGEPGEQRFGIPKEQSEFATSLIIPGYGLPRLPGSTAPNVATKITGPRTGKAADEARLLTKGGQETQAGLALREAATDPAKAERALADVEEIIPGSRPTTFQATGDYGLGQLERGVQTKVQAPFQERRAEQGVARINALESAERAGNPEEVANHIRSRIQASDVAAEASEQAAIARAEQQTQAAIARAERAGQAVGGTNTPEIYGQIMRRELDEANTATRINERTLWQAVDPENRLSVNTAPVMNAEFRIYRDEITQAGAASLSPAERTIGEVIQQYGQAVPFREMQDLRSLVSSAMRQELRLNGSTPAYARLTRLRGAIEESVSAPFEPGVPAGPGQAALSVGAADRLAEASAATRARAETFKQQPIRGVLQREGTAGPYPLTNAAVPSKIIPDGPKGYDHVNAYLRATEGRPGGGLQEISDAMVADMRAYTTDVNGNIDPGRLMSWARSKEGALRAVTERDGGALARQLDEVQQAGFGVKAATKEQARTIKEAAAQRKVAGKAETQGIFGDLAGVRAPEDVSKLLGSIFGSKTAVADAEMLMARLGTPEAQDGARRAITDWIANKLISNTAAGTTEVNILRADQFQSFIKDKAAVLQAFGFTPEQIKTWKAIAEDMRRAKMSIDATKVPGGSNTAQDLYAMKKFGLSGSKLSKILHLSGMLVGGWTSGPLGAIAGLLGAGKYTAIRDAGIKSVQDLIVKGMLEPDFGRQLLTRVTPKENIAFWRTAGMYGKRAVRAEVLTGSRHDQGQQPAVGYKYGGTVFPVGREGIQARNKARAFEARERSSLARQSAQEKRKVKYQSGGFVGEAELPRPIPLPRRRPPEIPRGPEELAEGQYDPTAQGGTRPGVQGSGYRISGKELMTPAAPTVRLPNVMPHVWEGERLGELEPFEKEHQINPLEQEYIKSFGTPDNKPYPVHADGGLVGDTTTPDIGGVAARFSDHPTINAMDRMLQNRKLAEGQYDTQLSPDQEIKYRQWKAQNAPRDSGYDYDLRGAYQAGVTPDQSGHMPDTYKKPNHPTFSDQSRYAPLAPGRAGSWQGETYVPPRLAGGGAIHDDSGKVSKESVDYSKGMPKAHCSICTHWRQGKCTEVQGKIWHSMWCKLFKRANKYAEGDIVTKDGEPVDESKIGNPNAGPIIGLGKVVAPNLTSVLTEPEEPYSKRLEQAGGRLDKEGAIIPPSAGKVPSTADPRMREAEQEGVDLASNLVPVGGAAKLAAIPLVGAARRAGKLAPKAPSLLRSEFERPLFDYSRMAERPDVPQFSLPRIIPARGIPEHIMRLGNPNNMDRVNQIVEMGLRHGGPQWYNTMPLRERYIGELGAERGPESHRSYFNYVGATSPRTPVPTNAGVASYYDMLAAQGERFPKPRFVLDPETGQGNWTLTHDPLPEGYGSLSQATNALNAWMVRHPDEAALRHFRTGDPLPPEAFPQGGWPAWTFFDKPKPPSFTSNLLGNYRPLTSDVHNVNMLNLRRPDVKGQPGKRLDMPPHRYYGYIEDLQSGPKGAERYGIDPAQYQASGWIPWAAGYREVGRHGEVTGGSPKRLQEYSEPFIQTLENRIKTKARERGWSPEQTLRAFLKKEIAVAGVPAAAIPLLQSRMGDEAQ